MRKYGMQVCVWFGCVLGRKPKLACSPCRRPGQEVWADTRAVWREPARQLPAARGRPISRRAPGRSRRLCQQVRTSRFPSLVAVFPLTGLCECTHVTSLFIRRATVVMLSRHPFKNERQLSENCALRLPDAFLYLASFCRLFWRGMAATSRFLVVVYASLLGAPTAR